MPLWQLPNDTLCPGVSFLIFYRSNSVFRSASVDKKTVPACYKRFYCRLIATGSGSVVPGRAVMETFRAAGQVRLMLSVMSVWTAIYLFFLFFSFFFWETLWALCHQLQMFSPTKLLTPIWGRARRRREERSSLQEKKKKQMWVSEGSKMGLHKEKKDLVVNTEGVF